MNFMFDSKVVAFTKSTVQQSVNNSFSDQVDSSAATPGRNVTKQPEVSVKLSDFIDHRYTMRQHHMGYFIIFNQDKYSKKHPYHDKPRAGSCVDAEKLEKSMKSLGFTVVRYDNRLGWKVSIPMLKQSLEKNQRNNWFLIHVSNQQTKKVQSINLNSSYWFFDSNE